MNVITVGADGRLHGSSTDGEGFVRSVREEGFDPAGTDVLVAGAGGAARAIVLALGGAGARVTVAARRQEAADAAAALVPGGQGVTLGDVDPGVYALVVNATPLGMQGEAGPVPVESLNPGQLVVDTVYHPMETPFLAAARSHGIHAVNGLGMLVHQAALAFESWTGLDAPVAAMRVAATQDPTRMTAALVVGCSVLGLVVGWFLDPVITRVPLKQPVFGPPGADEPPPSTTRRVFVTVLTGALVRRHRRPLRRLVDAARVPRAHRRAGGAGGDRLRDLPAAEPHRVPLTLAMLALLAVGTAADGALDDYLRGLLAAVIAFAIFFVLHLVSPRSMGFGDVKLSFTLGLSLGVLGWGELVLGLFLGFFYGAVIGLILIATKLRGKGQAVPFGPFLAAGALTAVLIGAPIIDWYTGS